MRNVRQTTCKKSKQMGSNKEREINNLYKE